MCRADLWDHRNESLREWLINEYVGGSTGVDNTAIHGLFMDNGWPADKPAEVQADAVIDMGLTPSDVAAISRGWQKTQAACQQRILASGGFNWQLFNCQFKPNATHTCSGAPQTAPRRSQVRTLRRKESAWCLASCSSSVPSLQHPVF